MRSKPALYEVKIGKLVKGKIKDGASSTKVIAYDAKEASDLLEIEEHEFISEVILVGREDAL